MAVFIDGFEQFLDDALALVPLAGYTTGEFSTAEGRLPTSTAIMVTSGQMQRNVPVNASGDIVSVGVAVRFEHRGSPFLQAQSAVVEASPVTGRLSLNGVAGEVIPAAGRYYYYEIETDWAKKQARLYVNGLLDVTAPYAGARTDAFQVSLKSVTRDEEDNSPVSFDDLYIKDGARFGPIEIATQLADEDASPQAWLPSVDEEPHSRIVGAQPPDMLNRYVQSSEVGARDRYTSSVRAERDDVIKAMSIITLARVTAGDKLALITSSDGREATAKGVNSNYAYQYTSVPFTAGTRLSAMADTQFGVEVGAE